MNNIGMDLKPNELHTSVETVNRSSDTLSSKKKTTTTITIHFSSLVPVDSKSKSKLNATGNQTAAGGVGGVNQSVGPPPDVVSSNSVSAPTATSNKQATPTPTKQVTPTKKASASSSQKTSPKSKFYYIPSCVNENQKMSHLFKSINVHHNNSMCKIELTCHHLV